MWNSMARDSDSRHLMQSRNITESFRLHENFRIFARKPLFGVGTADAYRRLHGHADFLS